MKTHGLRSGVLAVGAFTSVALAPALADPAGLWRGSDGGMTRITRCGPAAYCGYLATVVPPNDPATGRPKTDKNNPDPAKRNRPLAGVQVLINMRPSGPGKWSGQLYYSEDGHFYAGHLIEQGPSNVRVEGCSLGICGGDNLTRAR